MVYVGILSQSLTEYLSRLTKRLRSGSRMRVDTRKANDSKSYKTAQRRRKEVKHNASALDHSNRTCGCSPRWSGARYDLLATGRKNVRPLGGEASLLSRSEKRRRAWQV